MRKKFDAIKLIYLVRERRALYDFNHHRDKQFLSTLWQEIASKLQTTEREAKMKWQNLRSNYCRERRKLETPGPPDNKTSWPYFELMSFLDEFSKNIIRRRLSSESESILIPDDEDEPELIVPDTDDICSNQSVTPIQQTIVTKENGLLSSSNEDKSFPVITSYTSLMGKRSLNGAYFIQCNNTLIPVVLTPDLAASFNVKGSSNNNSNTSIDSANKVARLHNKSSKSSNLSFTEKSSEIALPCNAPSSSFIREENQTSVLSECSDDENLFIDETNNKNCLDKDDLSPDIKVYDSPQVSASKLQRTDINNTLEITHSQSANDGNQNNEIIYDEYPVQETETHDSNYESLSERRSIDGDCDPDMLFLRSLMPSIKELSHVYNLEFKEEVLKLLKRKLILSSSTSTTTKM